MWATPTTSTPAARSAAARSACARDRVGRGVDDRRHVPRGGDEPAVDVPSASALLSTTRIGSRGASARRQPVLGPPHGERRVVVEHRVRPDRDRVAPPAQRVDRPVTRGVRDPHRPAIHARDPPIRRLRPFERDVRPAVPNARQERRDELVALVPQVTRPRPRPPPPPPAAPPRPGRPRAGSGRASRRRPAPPPPRSGPATHGGVFLPGVAARLERDDRRRPRRQLPPRRGSRPAPPAPRAAPRTARATPRRSTRPSRTSTHPTIGFGSTCPRPFIASRIARRSWARVIHHRGTGAQRHREEGENNRLQRFAGTFAPSPFSLLCASVPLW